MLESRNQKAEKNYKYNSENQLIEVTISFEKSTSEVAAELHGCDASKDSCEVKVLYSYDGLGRRIRKEVVDTKTLRPLDSKTLHYLYDNDNIIAILDGNNNLVSTFVHGPNIDEPLIMTKADGSIYFYHADALGSITSITDEKGKLAATYEYKVYGKPSIAIYDSAVKDNPYMFTAREYDEETGLYFYRARYYSPHTGRFLQEDPIGFQGGNLNLYAYVGNNPINFVDPSGTLTIPFLGRVNLGECSGEKSAQWYADKYNESGLTGKIGYGAGGLLASLWTPDTSNYTALTLGSGYALRIFGPFSTRGLSKPSLYIAKLRRYFRFDSPTHGKSWEFDGDIIKFLRGGLK